MLAQEVQMDALPRTLFFFSCCGRVTQNHLYTGLDSCLGTVELSMHCRAWLVLGSVPFGIDKMLFSFSLFISNNANYIFTEIHSDSRIHEDCYDM